ncbi:hypothetical protein DN752_04380 [Echinicola strongylocentroti]|uniref:Fibrobacter succinogenes major paralogous domain-containing protein n=1 Tax=Echinicola strongylocentroti TaxID=1795355 RepID=A0A2Z4IED5_9BACT|nr:fibrobacter succinogenes major paralogous domain-containing protein [Echinicola strongylocentroti]AWW29441.1 hypothetical protein DN752_04380 [Echinicola strongylocentroti]
MKKQFILFAMLIAVATGCVQEGTETPSMGSVSITGINIAPFGSSSPNQRQAVTSEWEHIFPDSAAFIITNEETGQEYILGYDPNDFSTPPQIQLPMGSYTILTQVEGTDMEYFLPYEVWSDFEVSSTSQDIALEGHTYFGLVTVKKDHVLSAKLDGTDLVLDPETNTYYIYAWENDFQDITGRTLEVQEDFTQQTLRKHFFINSRDHYHFNVLVPQGEVNFIELALGEFRLMEYDFDLQHGTVTDASGHTYTTVKIGDQYWMAQDLRSTQFCNGDSITIGYSSGLDMNEDSYLRTLNGEYPLYSAAVLSDERNICPCGWHISTDQDWKALESELGITAPELDAFEYGSTRGADVFAGTQLKDPYTWPLDTASSLANASGLSAIRGTYMYMEGDYFQSDWPNEHYMAYFWSPNYSDSIDVQKIYRNINGDIHGITRRMAPENGEYGYPIRCVKD